jgi:hypothetical protein
MHLLRSVDRNVKVLKRDSKIRWTRLCILRGRGKGHLILLRVEERSEPDVGQDEDCQKYLDEVAQRVFLFLDAVLLYAGEFKGNSPGPAVRRIALQST